MKKVKFNKLTIKNFRNINELEINFNENTTEIIASNGKGKTNTLSAIMWCLWGKDISDNKQFTISPIINGLEDNSINTIVKMVINDNYVIERSYCKRVSTLKTGYIIDDKEQLVAITQTQFKDELSKNVVDEETFKSLSNINYLTNLHWKDLKKFIFDLIGDIKNEEILLRDDFKLIEDYINKFGIDATQKLLTDTDKELSDDIKRLETEYQTLNNTKDKYVSNQVETEELEKRKKELEDKINNTQKLMNDSSLIFESYNNKKQAIISLKNEHDKLFNQYEFNCKNILDYDELYKKNGYDPELLRERELSSKKYEIETMYNKQKEKEELISKIEKEQKELVKLGTTLKEKEVKVENDVCSACGQRLPEDKIKSTLENLKEIQLQDLTNLQNDYKNKKLQLSVVEAELQLIMDNLTKLNNELEEIKTKQYDTITETDKQKEIRVAKENKELDNIEIDKKIDSKNIELETLELELSKIDVPTITTNDTQLLMLELNEINSKLATTITLGKISEDINATLDKLNEKKDNKISNHDKMQMVIKFNNIKADLLKQKVRNYFKLIDFKTKEYTIDGTEQETFKICNDKGVEFKEVNTGHKILLGIDLLQGIMKAKEIYIPIIVDNVESVSSDLELENTQLIIARAVKNVERIEVK